MTEIHLSDSKIVFESDSMHKIVKDIADFAPVENMPIFVTGENGTGKENIARLIHAKSPRSDKPFYAINCAAISPNLLESELFGHERGSFTGADKQRIGAFEQASGGTLFLDEIGEMPPEMQVKLLRVLQDGEIRRVGGNEPIKVNPRIIAATNIDIDKAVAEGKLRKDLYHRLNGLHIKMPPLAERSEDIEGLAKHFAEKYSKELNLSCPEITTEAFEALRHQSWPGNIRQLENTIRRATVKSRQSGVITPELLGLNPNETLPPPFPTIEFPGEHSKKLAETRARDIGAKVENLVPIQANPLKPEDFKPLNTSDQEIKDKLKEQGKILKSLFVYENGIALKASEISRGAGVPHTQLIDFFLEKNSMPNQNGYTIGLENKLIEFLEKLGKPDDDIAKFKTAFQAIRELSGYKPRPVNTPIRRFSG